VKDVVEIQVANTPVLHQERIRIYLNQKLQGEYRVHRKESPVEGALLLLGFDSVVTTGENWGEHRTTFESFAASVRSEGGRVLENFRPTRGEICLMQRWSEPLEESRVNVSVNGEFVSGGSVSARMGLSTLRSIVALLGFEVRVHLPQRAAA